MLKNLRTSHTQRYLLGVYASVATYLLLAPKKYLPACPIHSLFGIYCPACGGTRAMRALLTGDFRNAIHDNALLCTVPFFVAIGWFFQKRYSNRNVQVIYTLGLMILTLGFTIIRNMNHSPLAPIAWSCALQESLSSRWSKRKLRWNWGKNSFSATLTRLFN